ncbi:hypothetical protein KIP72_28780 [Pseudomonas aeruginosa]|nr:hypothetical protein [Pseudomonas aeruginosa]MBT9117743.1 hypothetical protein [Pseudomonas aeruginosa]
MLRSSYRAVVAGLVLLPLLASAAPFTSPGDRDLIRDRRDRAVVKTRGDLDNRGGQVVGLNELQVQAAALDNRSAGLLSSKGDMDIEVARLDNSAGGKLVSERRTLLKADRLDNRSGRIVAGQDLDLSSRLIDNRAGDISSTSRVVASAREQLDNRGGKIVGDSGLDITTPRMLNQDKGVLASRDGLRLSAGTHPGRRSGRQQPGGPDRRQGCDRCGSPRVGPA